MLEVVVGQDERRVCLNKERRKCGLGRQQKMRLNCQTGPRRELLDQENEQKKFEKQIAWKQKVKQITTGGRIQLETK